jgi:hypothetical protein
MRNSADYAKRSTLTIIRVFMIYKPMRFFAWPGIVLLIAGGIIGLRFLVLYVLGGGQGHVQSLILAAILIVVGTILCIFSLIAADLIAVNRRLLEELQTRARSLGRLSSPSGLILIGDAAQVQSTPSKLSICKYFA